MQQAMSTVEGKKQEKRRALLDAAYELFLERGTSKTSVEDITSRAKVGKGTFYLYFADKGSVTQALLARVSYQLLDNACAAASQAGWVVAEVGRQPWAIQDLMPVGVAASKIPSGSVSVTFFLFLALFTALLAAELSIMFRQIKTGPKDD